MKRIRSYGRRTYRRLAAETARAKQNPLWTAGILVAGVILVWGVLTTSLADAVADSAPEFALQLNRNHPTALLVLAERRAAKLRTPSVGTRTTAAPATTASAEGTPPAPAEPATDASVKEHQEIRILVSRAVASDPLNGRAYGLLGEIAENPQSRRMAMQEALKRSRRESHTALWLAHDSFERQDFADVVAKADILLRTRNALAPEIVKYLSEVAASPDGRGLLVNVLAGNPAWRGRFFASLPKASRQIDTPLALMLALKDRDSPPTPKELAIYLRFLVNRHLAGFAYDAWLQFLPADKVDALELINNLHFAEQPGEIPFDWQIARGLNATVEFRPVAGENGARALRLTFGSGRVKFPQVSQIVVLAPGRYRFAGVTQGTIAAKRGLRWQLQCHGTKIPKFETEMLYGNSRAPQAFALDIEVPNQKDCRAQVLRLMHDARSASEEMVTGEIQFQELSLTHLEQ